MQSNALNIAQLGQRNIIYRTRLINVTLHIQYVVATSNDSSFKSLATHELIAASARWAGDYNKREASAHHWNSCHWRDRLCWLMAAATRREHKPHPVQQVRTGRWGPNGVLFSDRFSRRLIESAALRLCAQLCLRIVTLLCVFGLLSTVSAIRDKCVHVTAAPPVGASVRPVKTSRRTS